MKKTKRMRAVLSAALLVAGLLVLALPGPAAAGQLAEATVHTGGVDFLPNVAFSAARITVSGREVVYQRAFGAGDRLSVDLFDPEGQLLPAGTYKWRLELTPTAERARELRRATRRNGGIAPDAWEAETGTFAVRDGLMVDRGLVETGLARRAVDGDYGALAMDLGAPAAGTQIGDDSDDAVNAGTRERRTAATAGANRDRADAEALAAGPAPERAVTEEQAIRQRSYPTDGKNGRD